MTCLGYAGYYKFSELYGIKTIIGLISLNCLSDSDSDFDSRVWYFAFEV